MVHSDLGIEELDSPESSLNGSEDMVREHETVR